MLNYVNPGERCHSTQFWTTGSIFFYHYPERKDVKWLFREQRMELSYTSAHFLRRMFSGTSTHTLRWWSKAPTAASTHGLSLWRTMVRHFFSQYLLYKKQAWKWTDPLLQRKKTGLRSVLQDYMPLNVAASPNFFYHRVAHMSSFHGFVGISDSHLHFYPRSVII